MSALSTTLTARYEVGDRAKQSFIPPRPRWQLRALIPVIPALELRPRKLPFVQQNIEGYFAPRERSSKSLPLGSDRYRHSTCSLEATLGLDSFSLRLKHIQSF